MGRIDKKAQVTIFIIVALVLVAFVVVFFAVRQGLIFDRIPSEFQPIYSLYGSCIDEQTSIGLSIMGTQGGRLDVGEYAPGSDFAPFSSHLNFLGFSVPYWFYVSGNNIVKMNVPSINDMENELERYIEENINENCNFKEFEGRGFVIEHEGNLAANVKIENDRVEVDLDSRVIARKEDRVARKSNHEIVVDSKLGQFFELGKKIYNKQLDDAFLEEYAVDVLRNYVPVDGVEVTCSPLIWKTPEVVNDLKGGLEANIGAIKFSGNYYRLNDAEDDYFVVDDISVDQPVRLLYNKNWPSKVEVSPADEQLMIAEPFGETEGLGLLGYCYVPYHFVYDVSFPVMVQFSDGFDIFQFPIVVVIDNNVPREADLLSVAEEDTTPELCEFKEGNIRVNSYDNSFNPVEAEISYQCFETVCDIGRTELDTNSAEMTAEIPLCYNGYLIAKAEGYAERKQLFSSNSETVAEIFLDKEYDIRIEVKIGEDRLGDETAVIHFRSTEGGKTQSAVLPEVDIVKLSEGNYEISVYVYGGSSVNIPAYTEVKCTKVNRGGVTGIFGATKEECFNIEIPETNIEFALLGGGKTSTYLLESELDKGVLELSVGGLPEVDSLEQLQYNYASFDGLGVGVIFK